MPPKHLFHLNQTFGGLQGGGEFISFLQKQGKQNIVRAKNKALRPNKCDIGPNIFGICSHVEDCFIQDEESLEIC